jgi:putative secretion ATPase (PEP-CTERM system associated)
MIHDHWGLTGRPFQLTPDPHFWFETATHRKAMAYLGYGLAQGEGFIVITGDIGAGKTTLLGHLLGTLDPQRVTAVKIVSSAIEADDLLRIVAGQLGVDPAGQNKAQLLVAIERALNAIARTGRRVLLVVDEAQGLPVSALEELRMLSNFQAGGQSLLQLLLLGQPEFRDRLQGSDRLEQLRQRIIAIHHLDPMEEGEVADYIAHRLSLVGWTGRPDFTEDAFEAFHAGSGGVPRRLNLLAARVMLQASIEGTDLIDGDAVRAVEQDLRSDLPVTAEERPQPAPAPETVRADDAPAPSHAVVRMDERLAALEQRVEQQDAALRRVLTLLVDWIEADEMRATTPVPIRGAGTWTDAA